MNEIEHPRLRIGADGEIVGELSVPEFKAKRKRGSRLLQGTRRIVRLGFWIIIITLSTVGGSTAYMLYRNQQNAHAPATKHYCYGGIDLLSVSDGKLVFRIFSNAYSMNFDGTSRHIFKSAEDIISSNTVTLSPDGNFLLVAGFSTVHKRYELSLINLRNSNENVVAEGFAPAWSPDSKQVVYYVSKQGIFTIGIDGSKPARVADLSGEFSPPAWSPDGKKLAVDVYEGLSNPYQGLAYYTYDIDIIDISTGVAATLVSNDYQNSEPSWSPDGKSIAYLSSHIAPADILVTSVDGSTTHNLTNGKYSAVAHPVWSPDSKQIAFLDQGSIFIMNADGSNMHHIYGICTSP